MTPNGSNGHGPGSGGITGRGFQPGQSGNPTGRKRGLAAATRRLLDETANRLPPDETGAAPSDGAEVLTRFWIAVMGNKDADMRTRVHCSELLADRGWGKAPMYMPIEDADPLDTQEEALDAAVRELDAQVARLALTERAGAPDSGDSA